MTRIGGIIGGEEWPTELKECRKRWLPKIGGRLTQGRMGSKSPMTWRDQELDLCDAQPGLSVCD